jgi:hypothetical protein
MSPNVNHPSHYTSRDIGHECIDIAQYQTFCAGNAIKYLWRYKDKGNPVEDLKKAQWYALRASTRQEAIDLASGQCNDILLRLISSTHGYESTAWLGFLRRDWRIILDAIDMMIEGGEK